MGLVLHDAAANWDEVTAPSTTFAVTSPATVLVVCISTEDLGGQPNTVIAVSSSLDGAFDEITIQAAGISGANENRAAIALLLNPTVGSHNITVTWSSGTPDDVTITAFSLRGEVNATPSGSTGSDVVMTGGVLSIGGLSFEPVDFGIFAAVSGGTAADDQWTPDTDWVQQTDKADNSSSHFVQTRDYAGAGTDTVDATFAGSPVREAAVAAIIQGQHESDLANVHNVFDRFVPMTLGYTRGDTCVQIFIDNDSDVRFLYTDDHWQTWSETEVVAGSVRAISAYQAEMTPGTVNDLIHVAYVDDNDDMAYHFTIDLTDGTFSTPVAYHTFTNEVNNEFGTVSTAAVEVQSGRIYAYAQSYDAVTLTTEEALYESDNGGTSFSAAGGTLAWGDYGSGNSRFTSIYLMPADTGDGNDLAVFEADTGARSVTVFIYDESAGTYDAGVIVENASQAWGDVGDWFALAPRSDGVIVYLFLWEVNTGSISIETGEVDVSSTTGGVKTGRLDLASFTSDLQRGVQICVNTQNDDVYGIYVYDNVGSGNRRLVDKLSTDDMVTWGSETKRHVTDDPNIKAIAAPRWIGADGGWIDYIWFNTSTDKLVWDETQSVNIAPAPATGSAVTTLPSLGAAATGESGGPGRIHGAIMRPIMSGVERGAR